MPQIGWNNQTATGTNPGTTSPHNTPPLPGAGQGYGGSDPHWTPEQQQAYAAAAGNQAAQQAIATQAWQNYDQRRATAAYIRSTYNAAPQQQNYAKLKQTIYNPETGHYSVYQGGTNWQDVGSLADLKNVLGNEYYTKPEWQWQQEEQQANQGYRTQQENNIGLQYDENTGSWKARWSPTGSWEDVGKDVNAFISNPYANHQIMGANGQPIANAPNYFSMKYSPADLAQQQLNGEYSYQRRVSNRVALAQQANPVMMQKSVNFFGY